MQQNCKNCHFSILTPNGRMCHRLIKERGFKNPAQIINRKDEKLLEYVKVGPGDWCFGWMRR